MGEIEDRHNTSFEDKNVALNFDVSNARGPISDDQFSKIIQDLRVKYTNKWKFYSEIIKFGLFHHISN